MTKPVSDSLFTDDVAKLYESTLVPLIFEPYAADLAARSREFEPVSLLEVACGTGVATRALCDLLPATCSITSTDLNAAMIDHAKVVGTSRSVTWRQADVMALPCADDSFDVVVCQFSAMFFPDRVAAYQEVRRVLRSGGTFLFNMWNRIEDNDFANVVTEALGVRYPDNPPLFLARTPHGHGNPAEIEAEIEAAGYQQCVLDQHDENSCAPGPSFPAVAYCQGTPLRNEIEAREAGGLERATATATEALRVRYGDGPVKGRISAVIVAAS
jgi:ubiquinone/menaquinone biosynthesis C-methylase UbiE